MGYAKGNAVGTLLKVIGTSLGKASRAYARSLKSSGMESQFAKKTAKMTLTTAGKAIVSIIKQL